MNNIFVYFIAFVTSLQIYSYTMVSFKFDATISLINEELISSCVSEDSKLLANEYKDVGLLEIDHYTLINVVESILTNNLSFTNVETKYYFYDSISLVNCPIGLNYCNSVQMKISIEYQNKIYERTLRYEPIQT